VLHVAASASAGVSHKADRTYRTVSGGLYWSHRSVTDPARSGRVNERIDLVGWWEVGRSTLDDKRRIEASFYVFIDWMMDPDIVVVATESVRRRGCRNPAR
jgi:hypothetical protein